MEITSENFEAQFSLIEESIREAEFISIDTEFSGKFPLNDDDHVVVRTCLMHGGQAHLL